MLGLVVGCGGDIHLAGEADVAGEGAGSEGAGAVVGCHDAVVGVGGPGDDGESLLEVVYVVVVVVVSV